MSLPNLSSELRVKLGSRNNPIIQSNRRSINLFSIQECIFGIRRIQGNLRSAVWTVYIMEYGMVVLGPFDKVFENVY